MSIERLTIVYNSDSGLVGDLVYVAKKLTRGESCSLCEITHVVREKPAWKTCKGNLGIPVDTRYRDQIDGSMATAINGQLPCVVATDAAGHRLLVTPAELDACRGSVRCLEDLLRARLDA